MNNKVSKCPGCGGPLEKGFAVKTAGLSFVRLDRLKRFVFVDEDLQGVGLLSMFFPSRARYCPSFVCRSCRVYIVDYGVVLSRREAETLTASWEPNETQP